MSWRTWLGIALCSLAPGLGLCGCGTPTWSSGGGSGGGSVSYRTDDGSYIRYTCHYLTGTDGRIFMAIVANGCSGSGSRSDNAPEVKNVRGELHVKDGGRIDWWCTSKDGRNGKVVVDGQEFELANGALFLVSAEDKPTQVHQVRVEDGQLQRLQDITRFRDVAEQDDRIAAFLDSCKEKD